MPKLVEIDGDAPYEEVTEEQLIAKVEEAEAEVERIRAIRVEVRETASRVSVLERLAETDEEFQEAIDALNEAEKTLGRFRGAVEGQHVAVGTAAEGEKA